MGTGHYRHAHPLACAAKLSANLGNPTQVSLNKQIVSESGWMSDTALLSLIDIRLALTGRAVQRVFSLAIPGLPG